MDGFCKLDRDIICRAGYIIFAGWIETTFAEQDIDRDGLCRAGYIVFAGWIETTFAEQDI